MDPLAVLPPWIPEDDLILKNAIEAGASLESLAKGAVRFSRRYSYTELRDRWRALLYDPVVSAEAAAAMANLELAKSNGNGIREISGDGGRKRKAQSVRKQYYAMRKRHCCEVYDSFDLVMHDELNIEKNAVGKETGGNLNKEMNNLLVNNLVDYGNYSGLEEAGVGPSHSMSEVLPLWKTIEDVSVPAMPDVQVSLENENPSSETRGKCGNGVLNAPDGAVLGEEDAHISDSLLDLTNEDGLSFMDIDGKDETVTDKQGLDNVDSLLLSSPCDIQGNDASDVRESQKLDTAIKLAMPSGSAALEEKVANPSGSGHGDQHFVSDPGNEVQSSAAAAQNPHPEHNEEFVVCILNTEDPYIPCNDGTIVSIEVPQSVALKSQPVVKEVGYPDSSLNNQRKNVSDRSSTKEDIPSHSFAASQTVRSGLVPDINTSNSPVGVVRRTENPMSMRNSISAVSRQSNNVIVNNNTSHSRLGHATMMPASDGHVKQEVECEIDAPASAEVYAHPRAEDPKALHKLAAKSLSLDEEGGRDDDDDDDSDDNDIDNEIPYFSDAETMILEMDLCPTGQDLNASREVLRYQHEETKRTIMRLEQCAQSLTRRAIASRGALAVLYGHTMKHYIKKSEVILGRATDDVHVDIDLGTEGLANKISRRQALIKMEADGSFIIKNLGKSSIFLNGKEIATGQLRGLSASSLIEIRGLSFIFEVNSKCVRRYLENVNENRER